MHGSDIAAAIGAFFAAVAALAGLVAVRQARSFHGDDVRDRELARKAEAAEFDREAAERQRQYDQEREARRLTQVQRVSDMVAMVRDAAIADADVNPQGGGRIITHARGTYWNARKQLETEIAIYFAIAGRELPACREVASGAASMTLTTVRGDATSAFEELGREVEVGALPAPATERAAPEP